MSIMPDLAIERERMIRGQIAERGVTEPAILDAFRAVPREAFVGPDLAEQAYEDHPLPIEAGQTISQPYIVALMIEAAGVRQDHRVLEVGAGSGYAAAVIGQIAREVIAIERHAELARLASGRMQCLGYPNVRVIEGDGTRGWPEAGPYEAILVAAAGRQVPQALVDQLAPTGRLVMPVGPPEEIQRLVRVTKRDDGSLEQEELGPVRFVPLIGEDRNG